MKRSILLLVSLLIVIDVSAATDSQEVKVSRYATMVAEPMSDQLDLLSVIVSIEFPSHIATVGEALAHLLERSGYKLADLGASDPALPILLKNPLPMIHRKIGPVPLRLALQTLSGSVWELVVDPVNRIVTFELRDEFKNFRPVASN